MKSNISKYREVCNALIDAIEADDEYAFMNPNSMQTLTHVVTKIWNNEIPDIHFDCRVKTGEEK